MKPILRYTLLFAIIICLTTCKKDNGGSSATLPEATQEGKNTMGMKVNGEVWTPYFPCGAFSNPCGAINVQYTQLSSGNYYLNCHFTWQINNESSDLVVNSLLNISLLTVGNKYDSINIFYYDFANGNKIYGKSYSPKGNFTITKLDFTNMIISGIFGCTLYNNGDSLIITEGRFDFKFNACLCNN